MSTNVPPNEQPNHQAKSLTRSLERPGALRALIERAMLTWRLFWDSRVGIGPKLIPIAGLIYVVSPVDLLPAFLMGPLAPLGTLDDIGVILLALNLFIQIAPPDIVKEHLRELGGSIMHQAEGDNDDVIDGTARPLDE